MNKLDLIRKLDFIQAKEISKKDMGGYVYLLWSNGRSKIGISKTPIRRIHTIKVFSPFQVFTVCVRYFYNAREVEILLHRFYKKFRKKGEWFEISRDQIFEICDLLEHGWFTVESEELEKPLKSALLLSL